MAGQKIRSPYNVILAGDHDAGKTTIFNTLKTCFEEANSGKFQLLQGKRELRFESCLHKYLDSSKKPKLRLWDTGGMERQGGAMTMTRTYFRQVIAIILVYDTLNMGSLNRLRDWVQMAEETCEYRGHLIYALWGNNRYLHQSSVNNPVKEDDVERLLQTPRFSVIERDLVCRFNGQTDVDRVEEEYEKLVRHLDVKMREMNKQLDAVSETDLTDRSTDDKQGIVLDADKNVTGKKEGGCWC